MKPLTHSQMRTLLRKACDAAGSQVKFAETAGVPKQHITDVLSGRRDPWPALLKALGLREVKSEKRYERGLIR